MEDAHRGPFAVDVEELLAEGAWVRALARRLVGHGGQGVDGSAAADDVVQDTWLTALSSAPRDPAHRRSWLARVATNFAHMRQRGDARRTEREQRAARPEQEPSAADTAERLEAQRALVDALRALEEPYRTTVMRRYFDGLTAAEIARLDGIPAATVRWRLMRGVDELRAKLDKRYGRRDAWCVAFLPLARSHPLLVPTVAATTATSATLTGVLLMNMFSRAVIVSALVLSASLGVWLIARESKPLEPPAPTSNAAHVELEPLKAETKAAKTDLAPAAETESRAAVAKPVEKSTASFAALTAHVDGRFVDAAARPIAGVRITQPLGPDQKPVVSDAHGQFDVEIPLAPPAGSMEFVAESAGWATFFARCAPRPGAFDHKGDIVLEPGGAIFGIVLGPDGAPIAKAEVLAAKPDLMTDLDQALRRGPLFMEQVPRSTSANDGSFRLEGVPAKLQRVWAHVDGMRWAMSDPIEVPARGVHAGLILKLEPLAPDDRIEGIVLDVDGHPLPLARIGFSARSGNGSWSSSTDAHADGRFCIVVQQKVPHDLDGSDRDGRWPAISLKAVQPGTLDVVLRFREPERIDLVVTDANGAPLDAFRAELRAPNELEQFWYADPKQCKAGHVSIPVPNATFVIEVWAHGHEKKRIGPFEPSSAPPRLQCPLDTLPGLRGRVLAADVPVAGAKLTLHTFARSGEHIEHNGWPSRLNPNVEEEESTDADGRFKITVRQKGLFAILCEADGHALAEVSPLDVDPKVGVDGIEIRIGRGGTIEGRVLVPPDREAGGVIVGITRFDGFARTLRTGSGGTFRFEHLTPGSWLVKRATRETDASSSSTAFWSGTQDAVYDTNCVAEEGRTTHFDLDLRECFDTVIAGHVSMNGTPAAGWNVVVWPEGQHATTADLPGGTIDARGDVRLPLTQPSKVRVRVQSIVEGAGAIEFAQVLDLHAGDNPWIVDVATGALEGHSASHATLEYSWSDSSGLTAHATITPDAGGNFRLPLVPVGPAKLAINAKHERAIDVRKGETASVEVP